MNVVYLGVYRIEEVWTAVDGILDPGAENYDPRPAGECALAAIVLDEQGCVVPQSEVLFGLAWAAGRTRDPGPTSRAWLRGFRDAQEQFPEMLDGVQEVDRIQGGRDCVDADLLVDLRSRIAAATGLDGMVECSEIRVRSVQVTQSDGIDGTDYLNSFIADDLDLVADACRTMFFVVPLVSTTFASFDRVFRGLGSEALGWLLIDEAGLSTPQNPVGAIWRSRRTVVVGDPIQLDPVVTLPFRAQKAV